MRRLSKWVARTGIIGSVTLAASGGEAPITGDAPESQLGGTEGLTCDADRRAGAGAPSSSP